MSKPNTLSAALLRLFKIEPCPSNAWGHKWVHRHNWISGARSRFTGDHIGRWGRRCYYCGAMRWDQTDAEFAESIRDVVAKPGDEFA